MPSTEFQYFAVPSYCLTSLGALSLHTLVEMAKLIALVLCCVYPGEKMAMYVLNGLIKVVVFT